MDFEILSNITEIKKVAVGPGIRDLAKLRRKYGQGRWRKLKGLLPFAFAMDECGLPNYTGTRLTVLVVKTLNANGTWIKTMKQARKKALQFAVCINNDDYEVSLELHKIYRVLPDEDAAVHGDLRIIDESGEDYLFSAERFVPIVLPEAVQKSLLKAA